MEITNVVEVVVQPVLQQVVMVSLQKGVRIIGACDKFMCNLHGDETDNFQSIITLLLSVRIVKFKNSVVGNRPKFVSVSKLLGEMNNYLRYGPLFKGLTSNVINFMKE